MYGQVINRTMKYLKSMAVKISPVEEQRQNIKITIAMNQFKARQTELAIRSIYSSRLFEKSFYTSPKDLLLAFAIVRNSQRYLFIIKVTASIAKSV